jgi:hypothetical protein
MRLALLCLVFVLAASPGLAQERAACPSSGESSDALPLACVERAPQLDSAAVVPRVERWIARLAPPAGVSGRIRVGFEIDAYGRPVRESVRVLETTPDRLAQLYAERFARDLRFAPALRGGRPVRVGYEMELVYDHPGRDRRDAALPPVRLAVEQAQTPGGGRLALFWKPVADAPLPELPTEVSRTHQLRAISGAFGRLVWDSLAVACVSLLDNGQRGVPTAAELEQLRAVRARVAAPGECPETYGGMLQVPGRVRPPDAGPDPVIMRVTHVVPWAADWVVVWIQTYHSSAGETFRCTLHRPLGGEWLVTCESTERSLS